MNVSKEFPFVMISERPALQVFVEFSSNDDVISTLLKVLKEVSEPRRAYIAMVNEEGKFRAAGIIKAESEEELEEIERRIREGLKEIEGAKFEIYRMEKYGKGYMIVVPPKITLFGEKMIMIRESRFLSYLIKIANILGSGAYSFMRSLGEGDGVQILRMHKEHLKDLFSRNEIEKIVKYVMKGLYYLGNIPDFEIEKKGKEITLRLTGKGTESKFLKTCAVHYTYGMFHSIFLGLGATPREFAKGAGIAGMKIEIEGEEYTLRVERRSYATS